MFFIKENPNWLKEGKLDVVELLKDSGFKPKYDEDTGEIYKLVAEKYEFIKVEKHNLWKMKYLGNKDNEDIFQLFILFKAFDGIIQWGYLRNDGNIDVLKQEELIPRKNACMNGEYIIK